MNKVGFSVIFSRQKSTKFYENLLSKMLNDGCEAIEIHTPEHDMLEQESVVTDAINRFAYRSIHASDIISPTKNQEELLYYKNLINVLDAEAITVHPHTMQSWAWLSEYFGKKTSFENMDWRKPFGKNVTDMRKVFNDFPEARWTYDSNHVFTNDETMQLADEFCTNLNNIGHYHISGFQDDSLPHTTLCRTQQDSIIAAIHTDHPIIIESFGIEDIQDYQEEYAYVLSGLEPKLAP